MVHRQLLGLQRTVARCCDSCLGCSGMKTVASFWNIDQAYLARARLEASGVSVFVRDEFNTLSNQLGSGAIGGAKIDVADEDFDRAREILDVPPLKT